MKLCFFTDRNHSLSLYLILPWMPFSKTSYMQNTLEPVSEKRYKETAKTTKKYVFSFHEGDGKNKQLLGGKGANLCEMTQIGLNVPPGFVITTEACLAYLANPHHPLPGGLLTQVSEHMHEIEKASGKKFGDPQSPLLV